VDSRWIASPSGAWVQRFAPEVDRRLRKRLKATNDSWRVDETYVRVEHVLCYAPTRSGKGVGLIVPTLLSWKQSVFVTDLKGELYELTAGWRHEHAHNRILRFEPTAAAGSCCFNPMEELRIGTEHEVGDAQNLALLDGKGLRADKH
jgi:type IV secretory pathway TraG/TraD family ATPase VirD4